MRVLLFLVPLALAIYALIDCIQTDEAEVRNLPKLAWILVILVGAIVGPVAWLIAGRPRRSEGPFGPSRASGRGDGQVLAPDDDPEFLAQLDRGNDEHERMLKQWEEDLRRREDEMRREQGERRDGDGGPETPGS